MFGAVLLVVCCAVGANAGGGVYRVDRQDFSSPSPVVRSLGYQNLVNGRPGVYKVNRQDFAGNAPFAQNSAPQPGNMQGYYPQQKVLYPYELGANGYQSSYEPAPSQQPPKPPRLFVPAESGYRDDAAIGQPNYKNVLSLSDYNRRFETAYSQPTVPPYFQQPALSQTSAPSYFQYPAQSQTPSPLYFHPPVQSQSPPPSYSLPPAPIYSQPPINPYWIMTSIPSTTRVPPTTPAPTTIPPTTFVTYSPLPQAPAANEDDGILSPIPANDEENKPLPPVSAQDSLRKVYVTEDAAGNRHTKVKYHSFDDFVEISDEHRELLESFGSIQNNESDFSELPEASPIRRRRNATHNQVFSMFSVHNTQPRGAPVSLRDPEQLIGTYMNRLWQQIEILNDMRRAVHEAKLQRQNTKSSSGTIVAADDSTVVVFNGSPNFSGKLDDQVGLQESAENRPRSSVPLAESLDKDESNPSEDLQPSLTETNPVVEQSTESRGADALTVEPNLSEASHEVLLQRDEAADARRTSDPRDQIIYLTEEPMKIATHSSAKSWEGWE